MFLRRATLAAVAVVLSVALPSTASAEDQPKAAFTIIPLARSFNTFGLEWEQPLAGMTFFITPTLENPLGSNPLTLGLDLGLRFYPFAAAPRAFFIGPHLGAGYVNGLDTGAVGVQLEARVGAVLGYTLLLADFFLISVGVGGEYANRQLISGGQRTQGPEELRTLLRGAFGFAF
jgi:hypothetical protein